MPRRYEDRTRTVLLISNNFSGKSDDLKEELEVVILIDIEQLVMGDTE